MQRFGGEQPSSNRAPKRELSLGVWLVVAAVFHAGAFAAMRSRPLRSRVIARLPALEFMEVSLVPAETADSPQHAEHATPETSVGRLRAARTPLERREGPSSAAPEPKEPPSAASPSDPQPGAPARTFSLAELGAGTSNPFVSRAALTRGEQPDRSVDPSATRGAQQRRSEQRLEHSMRSAILEQDRAAGMGRGGVVATALRAAALHVGSPGDGRADFVATVSAGGFVVSLEPVSVSSSFAEWSGVAAHALRALRKKRVRIPAGASGLSVRLSLTSKIQLPSGHSPGTAVSVLGIPVKKAKKDSTSVDILKPHASVEMVETTDPGGGDPLRLPAFQIGVQVLGVNGDPVDIGAHPQRMVQVKITEEKPL